MEHKIGRRRFLTLMGAAAVSYKSRAVAAAGQSSPVSPAPWRMRLATSSIHFMELPIEKACERIAELGFEAIDIWSAHEGCPHLDDVASRLGPDGLKELLDKHHLKLSAFSVYAGGYVRYAELLGNTGGGVAVQGSAAPCTPDELIPRMRRFMEDLKPLIELAEKCNSYLAIENHGSALLDSLDSFKAFVDTNRSPRVGIALAPYHIQVANASVPEAIRICGRQLLFFYAWQNQPDSKQLPGVGPTDMTTWIRALADVKYRGYVHPFMHDIMTTSLATARDYLRSCHTKVRETTDI
jgi:sugar phosphate isomerase/epimerase